MESPPKIEGGLEAERHTARRRQLIERLAADGADAHLAARLLSNFDDLLAEHRSYLRQLTGRER